MDPETIQQWQAAFASPETSFIIAALGGTAITTVLFVGGKLLGFAVGKDGSVKAASWNKVK